MALKTRLIRLLSAPRLREIDRFMEHPAQVQQRQLRRLLDRAAPTLFGTEHGFHAIRTAEQFASRVPVTDYDGFTPYIERMRRGEADVCWPGEVRWFAKSSGTTSAKSKFIPVSREGLRGCHMRGPLDIVCLTSSLWPDTDVFSGKTLTLGGSRRLETTGGRAQEGDLSAILIENTPWLAGRMRVPKPETALIPDFEKKVEAICRETVGQNVTAFAGVPSWNLVMLRKVLEFTGKSNLLEVWPRLELFTHGGMNFKPYREQYRQLIPSDRMKYMETYNASEGFFAIQNDPASDDLLLMLDYGVYYEFLPVRDLDDPSRAVPLEGVAKGINYAMIITTCNGLWRYQIGDTVEFTSLAPYKIRITGRTRHYINAFGEEVIVDNAETALKAACDATGARISDYTAGPVYMNGRSKGSHQWVVEFDTPPDDAERFTDTLDRALQSVNSDYEAKRFKDTTLMRPTLTVVPPGTFYRWMKSRGKAGGQNKVPRLFNDRTYIDQLIADERSNDPK
ncbi:GH3 auxin-responsive promoter family protein [Alistipes ihumii]|uniref:GH3 auxin-responsive promoter family protein n=2 Tax=Alistipes ihumii TaxID=1470347 RepID=UPI00307BBEE0